MSPASRGRVLMIIENEGVPDDRRVWDEARTIVEAGWEVVVVCPAAEAGGQPAAEQLDGIAIRRFPLRPASGPLGYLREYLQALARIRRLVRRAEREGRFDVVHVANPPDFLGFAAARARARGARLIFDHHDLVPELYETRYGRRGSIHRLLLALERRALRTADAVIATNDSYRRIAIERGGVAPDDVFVVRNGPDLERFRPVAAEDSLRRGKPHLIVYLGVMGPQDGIDWALAALAELREIRGDDWHAAFLGDGEVVDEMRSLAADLGLGDLVEFVGWSDDDDIRRWLSTADVCLASGPAGTAQRRLDDGEDSRVHGDRQGDRLLRPARVSGVRRRCRRLRRFRRSPGAGSLRRRAARRSTTAAADRRGGEAPGHRALLGAIGGVPARCL